MIILKSFKSHLSVVDEINNTFIIIQFHCISNLNKFEFLYRFFFQCQFWLVFTFLFLLFCRRKRDTFYFICVPKNFRTNLQYKSDKMPRIRILFLFNFLLKSTNCELKYVQSVRARKIQSESLCTVIHYSPLNAIGCLKCH